MMSIKGILSKILNIKYGDINKRYLKKILPEDCVIVEAGAHVGVDTVELATLFPKANINAFEPIPGLYKELVKNTRRFKNVNTFQIALSEFTGKTRMYVSDGASDASSSILKPSGHLIDHPDVKFGKTINVNCVTIKDWVRNEKVSKVDFFWLDMQGYEMTALQKSAKVLKSTSYIYTEVSLKNVYENAPLYPKFKTWLEKEGYAVSKEFFIWPDMGNVLFLNKNVKK